MKRVLILGATGFIGRNMVERFASGNDVMAALHKGDDFDSPKAHRWWGDLRDSVAVSSLIGGWEPDIIIQAAATTSGSKDITSRPEIHVTDNAVMNSLIFRAAHDAGVKHVIFFSCTTMFKTGRITEESPLNIHDKYFGVAHTKLYIEKLAEFYSRVGDTKFTVIRHSNCYGPHDKFDLERSHVMGATIRKVEDVPEPLTGPFMGAYEVYQRAMEQKIKVWGTGEETRDLLYIDDLVDFVELAIKRQPEKFGLYNAGAGHAVSINDLVRKVIEVSGKNLTVEHDLSAPTIPTSLWLDCGKAERELGWTPKVGLEEGIHRTLEWYRGNVLEAPKIDSPAALGVEPAYALYTPTPIVHSNTLWSKLRRKNRAG